MTDIRYEIDNLDTVLRAEDISVFLFYAKNINDNIASKLFFSLRKKTMYELLNDINTNLDPSEDLPAYFNTSFLQDGISFITTVLIPSMQNETVDMWGKYGGFASLKAQINNNTANNWSSELCILSDYVPESMEYYIDIASEIKMLLQRSLSLNTPMLVSYFD
ncbi:MULTISPECIES: hypothetical protein [Chryseobacterium]|uniref:Uncharacterized protein n=1 Tax=Chryseobacterium pennae TaxID=2258962 RepID=A0A3D9CDL0_9FLAO|nr:hypothetical protein [Chryseobacterium pennae]REC63591.1 hypothetical protein DRF65_05725 [Chryseobacterium pennae]